MCAVWPWLFVRGAGVGMSHLTANVRNMLGKFTKTDQDNYPEMLGHICIINAPTVFQWVWAIVKGMIDKRTQDKIEVRQHILCLAARMYRISTSRIAVHPF